MPVPALGEEPDRMEAEEGRVPAPPAEVPEVSFVQTHDYGFKFRQCYKFSAPSSATTRYNKSEPGQKQVLVPSGKSPVRQKAMEEEQAHAEAMSEEREEGRAPEERAQSASASGASSSQTPPAQDFSLRFKILEREKIIVGGCFWATLANIYCAKEHEKADKDWNTVIMNRNEWPADLDWLILLNLLSRQEKDKHGIIGYRIEKKYDEGGKVRYVYPSDDKPVEGTVVARILHVWEVNFRDLNRKTALFFAISYKHWEVVNFLIERGASLDVRSTSGQKPRSMLKSAQHEIPERKRKRASPTPDSACPNAPTKIRFALWEWGDEDSDPLIERTTENVVVENAEYLGC
eukprot:s813_g6.t2